MAKTQIEKFFDSLETDQEEQQNGQNEQNVQQDQVVQPEQTVSEQSTDRQTLQEQPKLGKFASVDELLKSYEEMERKFYDLQEKLKRAEQGLEAFSKTQPMSGQQQQLPSIEITADPLVDPKGFAKQIVDQATSTVLRQVSTQIEYQRQLSEVRERFYKSNPDLVGKERLVGLVAQDVAREMPSAQLDTVLEEVAKRTRQFLRSLVDQQKSVVATTMSPPAPTPQNTPTREKTTPPPETPLSPDEELEAYIKQRKEYTTKRKF